MATSSAKLKVKTKSKEKLTIGSLANRALLEGKSTEKVITIVKASFPHSKINASSVGWYRRKLKNEGKKVTSDKAGRPAAKKIVKVKKVINSKKSNVVKISKKFKKKSSK